MPNEKPVMTNQEALNRLEDAIKKLRLTPPSVDGLMANAVYAAETAAGSIGHVGSKTFVVRTREVRELEYEVLSDDKIGAQDAVRIGAYRTRVLTDVANPRFAVEIVSTYEKGEAGPKCTRCGTEDNVEIAPDPYESDLRGDSTPVPMCKPCRDEKAASWRSGDL